LMYITYGEFWNIHFLACKTMMQNSERQPTNSNTQQYIQYNYKSGILSRRLNYKSSRNSSSFQDFHYNIFQADLKTWRRYSRLEIRRRYSRLRQSGYRSGNRRQKRSAVRTTVRTTVRTSI